MDLSENLLLLASLLVFFAILVNKLGSRFGAPSLLLFLVLGMVVGSDGLGVKFDDYEVAESIGHFAMTVILFSGGLQTSLKSTKPVLWHGVLLSTVGVLLTTLLTGGFIYLVVRGLIGATVAPFVGCLMLAAIMSSTDSASVFSVLHGKRLHLRENLGPLLELESGSNDAMAYMLTIIFVNVVTAMQKAGATTWSMIGTALLVMVLQLAVGFAVGFAVGYLAKWVLERINLSSNSLYSILILSIAFLANGLASLLHGNGLLAIYLSAIIISNTVQIPQKRDIHKFFDGMTWLMQLLMFLMLGLLAHPSQMKGVVLIAVLIGAFLIFVARPVSVFLTLLPFRKMSYKAKTYVSWVGLKGAGPILFSLCPVVAGLEGAENIFNIVFCITLMSLLLQGMTLTPVAKKLNLSYEEDPEVETFGMEVPEEMGILRDHVVEETDLEAGETLRDMSLPHGIRVIMVRRGEKFLVPHGSMKLQPGDQLLIMMGESDD